MRIQSILLAVVFALVFFACNYLSAQEETGYSKTMLEAMNRKMEKRIPVLEFQNASAKDVIEFIAQYAGLNFSIWVRAIEEERWKSLDEIKITVNLKDVTVRQALNVVMDLSGLGYAAAKREGNIAITTPDSIRPENENIVFEVADLRYVPQRHPPDTDPDMTEGQPRRSKRELIDIYEHVLNEKIPALEFSDASVSDILDFIAVWTSNCITIERRAIEEETGKSLDEIKITVNFKDVTVREALNYIANQTGLAYGLIRYGIIITVPERLKSEKIIVAYDHTGRSKGRNRPGNLLFFLSNRLMEMIDDILRANR